MTQPITATVTGENFEGAVVTINLQLHAYEVWLKILTTDPDEPWGQPLEETRHGKVEFKRDEAHHILYLLDALSRSDWKGVEKAIGTLKRRRVI